MSSGETTSTAGISSFVKESAHSAMSGRRPWAELLDPAALRLPASLSDATTRLFQNLTHFRSNYAIVALIILFLGLLYHPVAIIVFLLVLAAWVFLYFSRDEPLTVAGAPVADGVVLGALGLVTLVALILTRVWKNVALSVAIAASVIALHAVIRSTDDLVSDDRQSPYGHLATDDDPQGTYTII